jgi:drug/metabolite transporter (DMT)-like permease
MLLIIIGIVSAAMSHIALKQAAPSVIYHGDIRHFLKDLFSSGWFLVGAALHLLSLFFWLFGLRRTDLSLAHPMIALSLVIIVLYSRIWLNEPLGWHRILGMVLVIGGILTMVKT